MVEETVTGPGPGGLIVNISGEVDDGFAEQIAEAINRKIESEPPYHLGIVAGPARNDAEEEDATTMAVKIAAIILKPLVLLGTISMKVSRFLEVAWERAEGHGQGND